MSIPFTVTLDNGLVMPRLGLGTWKTSPGDAKIAVYEALKLGYRHIDCAWEYGNQDEVGKGIMHAISENIVSREDIWVTSKLWNDFHQPEDVEPHLRDTLHQLHLDYLDLFLVHWPATNVEGPELTPSYRDTWAAMEAVYDKGLTRALGVSNMTRKKLEGMNEYLRVRPVICQGEMHPFFRQDELLDYCKSQNIHWTAYAPLGSSDSCDKHHHDGYTLLQHQIVTKIAEETGKTPAQVLIRWALQRGTSVLPKSTKVVRIQENFQVWDWELSPEQFDALSSLSPQHRLLIADYLVKPGGPYKSVEEIWDGEL